MAMQYRVRNDIVVYVAIT